MLSNFNSLMFYIVSFIGSAYMLGLIDELQKKKNVFCFAIVCVALGIPILMAGYRSYTGTDTMVYIYNYVNDAYISWAGFWKSIDGEWGEIGHKILTRFIGVFTHTRLYLAVYAAITVILVYKVSKKFDKGNIALIMTVFYFVFFVYSFNGMRQYVAIAIVAYSLQFVFDRKFTKFLICIFLATAFHTSAILTIVLYFLWSKDNKLISWGLILPLLVIILVAGLNLESLLDAIADLELESTAINRYTTYTDNEYESKNRDFYLNLLIAIIALLHYKPLEKLDSRNTLFVIMMLMGTLLGVCGFLNPYTKRIALYFNIAEIWVLANIPKTYSDSRASWLIRFFVLVYAVTRFILIAYVLEQSNLIPYIWILPWWAQI